MAIETQQPARRLKKTMAINSVSLMFIWLLPLTASSAVTSGQNNNFTNVMTGTQSKFTHDQLTTQEVSSWNPLSEVPGRKATQSVQSDVNPTKEATKPSTKLSLQTALTTPSQTFLPGSQTAATPTNSSSSQLNSSTVGMKSNTETQSRVTTTATTVVTSHASFSTTTTPSMLSSSTQRQFTSDIMTRSSQSTNSISTTITSTEPVENKSTSSSLVRGGDATQSTGLYKTLMSTINTPIIHITKAKERPDPQEKNGKSDKGTSHSRAVAGLIGGALVLMMVGFLVIYIKKRKLQRQKITTGDWAGLSPFLEGGAVTLRSSNQISLSSFLPQRLSKRLSFLPETENELEEMIPGNTFGNKQQGTTFGQEVAGNDVHESNWTAVVVPEIKSTDTPETVQTLSQ
ncbi:putative GPI-anchored protein pfl2 [Cottoperca gobio]|uniref:GPI-anchored protein pfl2 n=1 Tax=Cottoperca gobio TaxID=56716 RepID=A0A6J2QZA1_COTGO|nr:putative GPI-anchored protein pfl2 [Cottoperca gobio]